MRPLLKTIDVLNVSLPVELASATPSSAGVFSTQGIGPLCFKSILPLGSTQSSLDSALLCRVSTRRSVNCDASNAGRSVKSFLRTNGA